MRSSLGLLAFVCACGGAAPTEMPAQPLPLPPPAVPAGPNVDLSPIAAPQNLVAVGRLTRPSKIPGVLAAWTGMPIPIDDALDEVVGDAVSSIVDMGQPVDVAVLLEAKKFRPIVAVSVGVRSIDDAKGALAPNFTFAPLANGAFKLEAVKKKARPCKGDDCDDDDEPQITRPCVLSPAYGSASARIVCGKQNLDALWPYMVRGVTRIETPSDLHVELRGDGLRAAFGDRTPFGMLARDLTGSAGTKLLGDLNQFGSDVDKIVLDGKLEDAGASATATISFREVRSPISKLAVAHADKAGPPPAAFLKLPAESDAALFESGIEPKELDEIRVIAADALDKDMEEDGVAQADRQATTDALRSALGILFGAPAVFAKGADLAGAQAAIDAVRNAKPGAAQLAAEKAMVAKMGGWNILGLEAPVATVAGVVQQMSAVVARPGILKSMTRSGQPATTLKSTAVPKGLPASSQHWELAVPTSDWSHMPPPPPAPGGRAKQPSPQKPSWVINKLHVLLVPDGGRTWMVWSLDDALAADKAKALVAPGGSTLGAKSGLEDLKSARANTGGFFAMRALALDSPTTALDRTASSYMSRPDPLYGLSTSTLGQTPVPFWIGAGPNQTMTVGMSVTRGVVRDGIGLSRALHW